MTAVEQSAGNLDDLLRRIDEAQNALRNAAYVGLRRTNCQFADGRLVLSGSVPSFYLKQVAQTLTLQALDAAVRVDNRLKVEDLISTDLEIIGGDSPDCQLAS